MSDAQTRIKTILTGDSSNFEAMCKRAVVTLNQTQTQFLQINKKVNNNFSTFGSGLEKSLGSLGVAFSAAAVGLYGRQVLEVADHLKTLEDRTGVSGSALRKYQADVENAGGSLDDLGNAINKMQIKLGQAEGGSKTAANAFASIGIKISDIQKLDPGAQFAKVATAISDIKDPAQRAAAAFTVFGKGAAPLLPFLEDFAKKSKEAKTWADKLTETMSPSTLATLDKFGDHINTLSIRLTNLAATGLANVINTMKTLHLQFEALELSILKAFSTGPTPQIDEVLKNIAEKQDAIMNPQPEKKAGGGNVFNDPSTISESADNAKKLTDELSRMQREANKNNFTSGMTPLQKKLAEVDFQVKELAIRYKTKLTPEQQRYVESTKAAIIELDRFERVQQVANDLGSAFGDAFDQAIEGGKKFNDVLGDLGKSIERIAFKAVVEKPIGDFFSGIFNSGGGSGILDSILGGFGSFATGTSNVPYDMTARLHRGETVLTRQQSDNLGGGSSMNVTVINNTPSRVNTKQGTNGDLVVMVDQAVAQNMSRAGTKTNQALRAQSSRSLVRR